MGQIINKGEFPFKPIDRKGQGKKQRRYRDTKDLRDWCEDRSRRWGAKPEKPKRQWPEILAKMPPEKRAKIEALTAQARPLAEKFAEGEREIEKQNLVLLKKVHASGQAFFDLKLSKPRSVAWKNFLVNKFPELGRNPASFVRRSIELFLANRDERDPAKFDKESVRKFWYYYLPSKSRGDATPQTEQSSSSVSAQSQTTLSRRARRRVRDNY